MKKIDLLFALIGGLGISTAQADMHTHMEGDPLLTKLMIDRFEVRDVDGENPIKWDIQGWVGKDLQKLWIKSEGRYIDDAVAANEVQLLYDRAVSPFWDLQAGWRRDLIQDPQRSWLALGLQGIAPYFIDVDTALFVGEEGRTALRFEAEYDLRITQKLILSPAVEINAYSKDDPELKVGSGLSSLLAGLRIRYEIVRQFAPYIGIEIRERYGKTADFANAGDTKSDDTWLVFGMRAWF
jgi:copper resistance protein B